MDKGKKKKQYSKRKKLQVNNVLKSSKDPGDDRQSASTELKSPASHERTKSSENPTASTMSQPSPQRPGSASPEPNCAICLGKLENKSFTDSCFHMFCFACLVEWSKVKAECPLCKQTFKSIVHNVRSYEDYDQYHILRPEEMVRYPFTELVTPSGIRLSYRTTASDNRFAHIADRISQAIENRLLQHPSEHLPISSRRHLQTHSDFRRSIYLQHLKPRMGHMDTRRRVRETSPSFYRDNITQTQRLVPWLNRELNALLQGHGEQVAFVLELIMGLIKRYPINSEEFYQHVFPFTGRNTRQFMQEFLMFAKSPYHMVAYDRHVTYEQSDEPHHDSESDPDEQAGGHTDDSNDVIVISPSSSPQTGGMMSQQEPPHRQDMDPDVIPGLAPIIGSCRHGGLSSLTIGQRFLIDHGSCASGWDSPTPGPSSFCLSCFNTGLSPQQMSTSGRKSRVSIRTSHSSSVSAPSALLVPPAVSSLSSFSNPVSFTAAVSCPVPSTSQGNTIEFSVSESDSNDSDVEIVEVEKPWVERSPIQLSSGEESDFEVMITGTSYINDPVKKEKKNKETNCDIDQDLHDGRIDVVQVSKDESSVKSNKKRHHHSRSKVLRDHSRSRSTTPVRLTIFRSADYLHKKFSYRTHQNACAMPLGRCSQKLSSDSSLSTDSEEDGESRHLSITSHQRNSRRSSIEIVEYRKKSSKYKKSKKHKKDKSQNIKLNTHEKARHQKKHKMEMDTSNEKCNLISKSGHSPSSDSKHKHKSKKKKPMHIHDNDEDNKISERTDMEVNEMNSVEIDSALDLRNASPTSRDHLFEETRKQEYERKHNSDCESDSESEIDVLDIQTNDKEMNVKQSNQVSEAKKHGSEKSHTHCTFVNSHCNMQNKSGDPKHRLISSNSTVRGGCFSTPNLEFADCNYMQAYCIDQEHNSRNKSWTQNTCTSSLFDETIRKHNENVLNPNRMVGNDKDMSNLKIFKKHPNGHKKSSKEKDHSIQTLNQASDANLQGVVERNDFMARGLSERSLFALNQTMSDKPKDNIHTSGLSSCSDIDLAKQLPSFCTFMKRNTAKNDSSSNESNSDEVSSDADFKGSKNFVKKSSAFNFLKIKACPPTSDGHFGEKTKSRVLIDLSYKTCKNNTNMSQPVTSIDVGENSMVEKDGNLNINKQGTNAANINHAKEFLDLHTSRKTVTDFLTLTSYKNRAPSLKVGKPCTNVAGDADRSDVFDNVSPKHHKAFEIADITDSHSVKGNTDHSGVIEVIDKKNTREVNGKEIVKLFVDSDSDMDTKLDYNYDERDDLDISGNSVT